MLFGTAERVRDGEVWEVATQTIGSPLPFPDDLRERGSKKGRGRDDQVEVVLKRERGYYQGEKSKEGVEGTHNSIAPKPAAAIKQLVATRRASMSYSLNPYPLPS